MQLCMVCQLSLLESEKGSERVKLDSTSQRISAHPTLRTYYPPLFYFPSRPLQGMKNSRAIFFLFNLPIRESRWLAIFLVLIRGKLTCSSHPRNSIALKKSKQSKNPGHGRGPFTPFLNLLQHASHHPFRVVCICRHFYRFKLKVVYGADQKWKFI